MANRIQLVIAGVSIIVSTPEDEAYVTRIAESVDRDMQALLSQTKASVTSAALLLAVDYMDRFQKANRSATNMRTQIKGYLADAANAKLLFDEEKKRSDNLLREASDLRSKLEQRSEPDKSLSRRVEELLLEQDALKTQLEYAENMLKASDTAERDAEITRLKEELHEHLDRIGSQSVQISQLEQQLIQKQEEARHLESELATLETMISEESAPEDGEALVLSENLADEDIQEDIFQQADLVETDDTVSTQSQTLPPLYRPNPVNDATYDFEDLPDLNWTEDI